MKMRDYNRACDLLLLINRLEDLLESLAYVPEFKGSTDIIINNTSTLLPNYMVMEIHYTLINLKNKCECEFNEL